MTVIYIMVCMCSSVKIYNHTIYVNNHSTVSEKSDYFFIATFEFCIAMTFLNISLPHSWAFQALSTALKRNQLLLEKHSRLEALWGSHLVSQPGDDA